VLKNAIDYLRVEGKNNAVGFVSYGGARGTRAAEHLRLICGALELADVSQQVTLSLLTQFESRTIFKPGDHNATALDMLLDQVSWSAAARRFPRRRRLNTHTHPGHRQLR
jgi:NAD(P)H-dependent FMN reductase